MRRSDYLRAWCAFVGAALLLCVAKLALGEKVDFEFVQGSKGYVVTAVK